MPAPFFMSPWAAYFVVVRCCGGIVVSGEWCCWCRVALRAVCVYDVVRTASISGTGKQITPPPYSLSL